MKYFVLIVGLAWVPSCVTEELATTEQEIGNGAVMPRGDQEHFGVVTLNGGAGTGVMLDHTLGISVGHVIDRKAATVGFAGDVPIRAGQTYCFSHTDFSVFKLDKPLVINGSTRGFANTLSDVAVGERVLAMGQGDTTESGTYDGRMREGELQVTAVGDPSTPDYTTMVQAEGRILAGDSGGPSFARGQIVGVHGMSEYGCTAGCLAYDITAFPMFGGIVAASEAWGAAATNLLNIMGTEIRVNKEIDYSVDSGPWYELARIGNEMCTNRNDQNAGHYTGFSGSDRYGLACSGRSSKRATVYQSSYGVRFILGLTAGFETIGWAEANAFAHDDCFARGHLAGYYTGDRDAQDNWTLNCYDTNKPVNATRAELVDRGFPGKDLANTTYAQAMRAAHTFCNGRTTYSPSTGTFKTAKTGFMTGRYERGKTYEIYCEF